MMISVCVFVLLLLPGLKPAAAESPSSITCNSTRFYNRTVLFQLSHGPSSSNCNTCWEDQNKTVMARGSEFHEKFVHSLTDHSIILADCRSMRYSVECSGMLQEIDCAVICSSHLAPTSPSTTSSHPDKPEWTPGDIASVVFPLSAFIILVVILWYFCKKKCSMTTSEATSYTRAQQTV